MWSIYFFLSCGSLDLLQNLTRKSTESSPPALFCVLCWYPARYLVLSLTACSSLPMSVLWLILGSNRRSTAYPLATRMQHTAYCRLGWGFFIFLTVWFTTRVICLLCICLPIFLRLWSTLKIVYVLWIRWRTLLKFACFSYQLFNSHCLGMSNFFWSSEATPESFIWATCILQALRWSSLRGI